MDTPKEMLDRMKPEDKVRLYEWFGGGRPDTKSSMAADARDIASEAAALSSKAVFFATAYSLDRVTTDSFEKQVILERIVNAASNIEDAMYLFENIESEVTNERG